MTQCVVVLPLGTRGGRFAFTLGTLGKRSFADPEPPTLGMCASPCPTRPWVSRQSLITASGVGPTNPGPDLGRLPCSWPPGRPGLGGADLLKDGVRGRPRVVSVQQEALVHADDAAALPEVLVEEQQVLWDAL